MMFSRGVILIGTIIVVTNGASMITDDLSAQQKSSVVALREVLKNDLSEGYMMEDYWLANWLKTKEFNVDNTAEAIQQYLKLRSDENLAQIVKEDWSEMRVLFPYSRNTTDKSGRPLLYMDMAEWDIVDFFSVDDEASQRLTRYILMMLEESEGHVRQLRAEGENISQYSTICNIDGFSVWKHVCFQCGFFYSDVTSLVTPYATANTEKAVFVNVPSLFKLVYNLFSKDTQKLIHLYGDDPEELKTMLGAYIDSDQIPKGILDEVENYDVDSNWDDSVNKNTLENLNSSDSQSINNLGTKSYGEMSIILHFIIVLCTYFTFI